MTLFFQSVGIRMPTSDEMSSNIHQTNLSINGKVNEFFQKSIETLYFYFESAQHFVFDTLPDALTFLSSKVEQIGIKNLFLGALGVGALSETASLHFDLVRLHSKGRNGKENNRLRELAESGNLEALRIMIDNGISAIDLKLVFRKNSDNNCIEAVKLILNSGLIIPSIDLHLVLCDAASFGHVEIVKEILNKGKNLSIKKLVDKKIFECALTYCTANTLVPIIIKALELDPRCLDSLPDFVDKLISVLSKNKAVSPRVEEFLQIVLMEQNRIQTSVPRRYTNYQLFERYKRLPIA
jgi:hypothetical protein